MHHNRAIGIDPDSERDCRRLARQAARGMGFPAGTEMMCAAILPPAVDPEPGWSQSLAKGAPGIALLHIERARSGLGAWSAVQQWATAATRHRISAHHHASLFTGAPAVAFALHAAGQPAYQPALDTLDNDIRQITAQRLAAAHDRIDRCRLPELAEFDLISGLTASARTYSTATRSVQHC
jgi:hypothetical protein